MVCQGNVNRGFEAQEEKQQQEPSPPLERNTEESEKPKRQQWTNKREFLLSCVSLCIGVGNVWRFSFVALENGGGAFVLPYLLVLLFCARPLYYLELILGQFSSSGIIEMWDVCPALRGVSYGQALSCCGVMTYYMALIALCLFYFFASFSSVLPWAVCGSWASDDCVPVYANGTLLDTTNATLRGKKIISSAEEYLIKEVLKVDPEGFQNGIALPDCRYSLCLLLSWTLLFLMQVKGIKSSGKIAYFTAIFPYVVLLTMFIRGVTLPGSLKGILFFITPRWKKLLDPNVWFAAVTQSLYSLGLGFGIVTTYASYNPFKNSLYLDATFITFLDAFTSVFAGITTFAILGHLADHLGVEVSQVVQGGGVTLAFVSYPDALARFTFLPQVFSALFFLMLFTLGMGSVIANIHVIIGIIMDRHPELPTWRVALVTSAACYLVGLLYATPQGQFIITLVDYYLGGMSVILLTTLETVGIAWVYGLRRFTRDIKFMLSRSTGLFWRLCWSVIPIFLAVVIVYSQTQRQVLTYGTYVFDNIATGVGVALSVLAVIFVPLVFLKEVSNRYDASKGLRHALTNVFTATSEWTPKDPGLRQEYLNMLAAKAEDAPQ